MPLHPDHMLNTYRYTRGGYLKDIPEPHIRMWPGWNRRRRVRLHCAVYGSLGRHYFCRAEEEDNPLWNSATQEWQVAWDDKEGDGRSIHPYDTMDDEELEAYCARESGGFDTHEEALSWFREMVAQLYSDETVWEVDWSDVEDILDITGPYVYDKEGD